MSASPFVRLLWRSLTLLALLMVVLSYPREAGAVGRQTPAWLGIVMLSAADSQIAVKHVFDGSPAHAAGLRPGDRLLRIDGRPVVSPRDVSDRVADLQPGDPCVLKTKRKGVTHIRQVSLAAYPGRERLFRDPHIGRLAPDIDGLVAVQGELPRRRAAWRGQVVLIAFWASWCENCSDLLAQLDAWQTNYRKRGLRVMGISSDNQALTRLALERWSVRHAVGIDPTEQHISAFGAYLLPMVYVVDRKGIIREVVMDYDPSQRGRSEKLIQKLLGER